MTRPERKTGKKISVGVSDDLRLLSSGRRDNPHRKGQKPQGREFYHIVRCGKRRKSRQLPQTFVVSRTRTMMQDTTFQANMVSLKCSMLISIAVFYFLFLFLRNPHPHSGFSSASESSWSILEAWQKSDLIFATLMPPFLLAYLGFFCFFLFLLAFFRFMFYVVCARVWYLALRHNNLLIT